MKKNCLLIIGAFMPIILLFTGCASAYRSINPTTTYYMSNSSNDGIEVYYKYDVLRERGNKKYAKKESKKQVKIVSLKVTNNTGKSIIIGQDALFYLANTPVIPLNSEEIKREIGQVTPAYLLYLLFTPLTLTTYSENNYSTETESYPIGLILGPGLAIGNMGVAASSNGSLKRELDTFNLTGKEIKNGETVFGLVGIRDVGYNPLSIRLNK